MRRLALFLLLLAFALWWLFPHREGMNEPPVAASPEVAAPSLAPAPPPPVKAALAAPAEPEKFLDLFESLDACELLARGVANREPRLNVWLLLFRRSRSLTADPELSPGDLITLIRLLDSKNLDSSMKNSTDLTPPIRFFAGLFYAGLTTAHLVPRPDYAQALRYLAGAEISLPGNAAIPFFEASVHALAEPDGESARRPLAVALAKKQFDTYLTRAARVFWEAGLGDPKLFVLSLSLVNRLPHLLFEPGRKELEKEILGQPELADRGLSFGQLLMRSGFAEGALPSGIYWSPEEYELGRSVARAAWQILHPGEVIPDNDWPLSSTFPGSGKLDPFDLSPFPPRHEDGSCDLEAFRRLLGDLVRISWERREKR